MTVTFRGVVLPAPFRQAIIGRCWSLALRATSTNTAMRRNPNLNEVRPPLTAMRLHLLVDEAHKTLYSIQDSFKLQLDS
jgi:hypothetical protein